MFNLLLYLIVVASLLEENSVIHHDVSQSLLLSEIRFFGDSLITRHSYVAHVRRRYVSTAPRTFTLMSKSALSETLK